jgi:hypothetical protein
MKMTLVAPFRVPFNLNKSLILADVWTWRAHLEALEAGPAGAGVSREIGRYAAGLETELVYKGVRDPGAGLGDLYTLRLRAAPGADVSLERLLSDGPHDTPPNSPSAQPTGPTPDPNAVASAGVRPARFDGLAGAAREAHAALKGASILPETLACFRFDEGEWELRVIDNNVGLLCVDLPLDTDRLLALPHAQLGIMDELSAALAVLAVRRLWPAHLRGAVEWLRARMTVPAGRRGDSRARRAWARLRREPAPSYLARASSVFDLPPAPAPLGEAYWGEGGNAAVPWVAHIYTVGGGGRDGELLRADDRTLELMGAAAASVAELREGRDAYGWAINLRHPRGADESRTWLDAMCAAQFYYYSLDLIDRAVPRRISESAERHRRGSSARALASGHDVVQEAKMVAYEAVDVKLRIAGDALPIVDRLFDEWDLGLLLENVRLKTDNLSDTLAFVSDEVDKRSDSKIEALVFFLTVLSAVSLFFTVHQYLGAPDDLLFQLVRDLKALRKDFVLIASVSTFALLVAVFHALRRRARR